MEEWVYATWFPEGRVREMGPGELGRDMAMQLAAEMAGEFPGESFYVVRRRSESSTWEDAPLVEPRPPLSLEETVARWAARSDTDPTWRTDYS